ncbi:S49 family peptidase [Reyranella sp.]|uniref:S49 family peptidase n=1 Tax=Reyranella sp. TaxID=1929291 RepID=UPI003BABC84D
MSDRFPARVFDAACAQHWAMQEEPLRALLEVASREPGPALEALAARNAKPLDNAHRSTVRDGVAIVPVAGPLFRYANVFTELSGATSVETMARDFTAALEDRSVRAILLNVDSPGGEVNGIAEMASMIVAARRRKPIAAYIGHAGASGAYWIATAADRVFAAPTALVGSVGAVMTIRDTRRSDEARGVRTIEIVSSQSPDKRTDPETEPGRAKLQAIVDRLGEEFVAAVAGQRGVAIEKVLADFGRGGVLVGADAVRAGMVDGISSFETVLAELSSTASPAGGAVRPFTTRVAAATVSEQSNMTISTIVALAAAYPDLVTQIRQESATAARAEGEAAGRTAGFADGESTGMAAGLEQGRIEGAAAERARILGIQAHALPGTETLVAAMVGDGTITPDQAAARILGEVRAQGPRTLANLKGDEPPRVGAGATPTGGGELSAYDRGRVIALRARGKAPDTAA